MYPACFPFVFVVSAGFIYRRDNDGSQATFGSYLEPKENPVPPSGAACGRVHVPDEPRIVEPELPDITTLTLEDRSKVVLCVVLSDNWRVIFACRVVGTLRLNEFSRGNLCI